MASAPIPGVGRREDAATAAQQIMTISVRGNAKRLAVNNVPISERLIVRKATGLPFEQFIGGEDKIGLDSIMVLWWLARRGEGDTFLTLDQAAADFDDISPDEIAVMVDEPDDSADDPEA
jgi:hypothetical protein